MAKPSEGNETRDMLKDRLIGLGEGSFRKSYYPELQSRLDQLERFRRLLDCTLEAILLVELPSERILDANLSACRLAGYSRERLLTLPVSEVIDLESPGWPPREEQETPATMVSTVLRRSDRGEIPVEVDISTDRFCGSTYAIVVARDISERLRAEASLRQSEWEKALILESTGEMIFYLDTAMRVVWANRAAGRSLNRSPEQLAGSRCWELWHRSQEPCLNCPIREALESGEPRRGEVTTDEGRVWFIRGYPVRDEKGEMAGVVELCLDITERKRAEEAILENDRMKSEFISTAAHELRTPLTAIQGFSQLLLTQEGLSSAEQREFLVYIHEKSVALSGIVSDLLDITRAESGEGLSFDLLPCPVNALVDQAQAFFRALGPSHRLQAEVAAGETVLAVDREKIAEVFENLLSNAVKYSQPGSTILLSGETVPDGYEFAVADQGIGMTPQQAARVFDKFYRADASNTAPSGLGLGMSLVKTIIETHGGKIGVESRPGEGTTVRFTLPQTPPLHESSRSST